MNIVSDLLTYCKDVISVVNVEVQVMVTAEISLLLYCSFESNVNLL